MDKTPKLGFDLISMLFGASVVILGITLYVGSASISKSKIQHKERMNDMEAQIDYLTMEVDYLEDKIDDMMLRIKSKNNEANRVFERIFEEMITHGQSAKDK
jgi:outer membrane murein-binding lipoprotein Lpp